MNISKNMYKDCEKKTIQHMTSACKMLNSTEYTSRHYFVWGENNIFAYIHLGINSIYSMTREKGYFFVEIPSDV